MEDTEENSDGAQSTRGVEPWGSGARRFVWTSKLDYRLTLIGYSVGLGNLWRFPYLCQTHGGAAFFIPYLVFLVLVAVPLVFLEATIGQFSRRGPVGAWGLCPLLRGVGISQVVLSALAVPYFMLVVMWSLYYLYLSLAPELTWATCGHTWNTLDCLGHGGLKKSTLEYALLSTGSNHSAVSATEQFWRNDVLRQLPELQELGSLQLHLVVTWLVTCFLVFLCVIKGMRSVGKVVYVTALLPYFLLAVLLVRSAMMTGAVNGILFFLTPDFTKLAHYQVWVDALVHVVYTLGPAWGAVITIASHNPANNNPVTDACIMAFVGVLTSVLSGFVVFSALGYTAHVLQVPIEHINTYGPDLTFIVFPEAVSLLPVPQLWSFLFYLLLAMLGIDSAFCILETVVTSLDDGVSRYFPTSPHLHAMLAALYMVVVFCMGLPFTTNAGIHIYDLVDTFLPLVAPLSIAVLEFVVISWFYGIRRFCVDMEYLLGRQPSVIMKLLWCLVNPCLLLITLVATIIDFQSTAYTSHPPHTKIIGWCVAVISLVPIPLTMIAELIRQKGSFIMRLRRSLKPDANWESSTQRYRAEEYEMWSDEKTSMLRNAKFIFTREKPG